MKKTYNYRNLAYALAYAGMFYSIDLDERQFRRASNIKTIVHSATNFPYKSIAFTPTFVRKFDENTGRAKYNRFLMTSSLINNTRQPPPYNTQCKDYETDNFTSQNDCIKQCMTRLCVDNFNKYPFSTIVDDRVELGHLTDTDLKNMTVVTKLSEIEKLCGTRCPQKDCQEDYTLTKVFEQCLIVT